MDHVISNQAPIENSDTYLCLRFYTYVFVCANGAHNVYIVREWYQSLPVGCLYYHFEGAMQEILCSNKQTGDNKLMVL